MLLGVVDFFGEQIQLFTPGVQVEWMAQMNILHMPRPFA
jgi:hypothetical protein